MSKASRQSARSKLSRGAAQAQSEDCQRNQNKRKGRDDIDMAIAEAKKLIVNDQNEEANNIVYDSINLTIK